MANPENNNPLPSPENPISYFKIEVKNLRDIYDFILQKNYQNPKILDKDHSYDYLGRIDIKQKGIDCASIKIEGTDKYNESDKNEFTFEYTLEINDRFSGENVPKIFESLSKVGKTNYSILENGSHCFLVNVNAKTYEVSLGFDWTTLNILTSQEYSTKEMEEVSEQLQKIPFNVFPVDSDIGISCDTKNKFLPVKDFKDFNIIFSDFLNICETFTNKIFSLKNFSSKYTLSLKCPTFDKDKEDLARKALNEFRKSRGYLFKRSSVSTSTEFKPRNTFSSFDSIAGQSRAVVEAKKLVLAINHPEIYEKRGVKTPKGILFYGPPGTGKTLIAKAVVSEINAELFEISFSDIASKWYGESEKGIQEVFDKANNATKSGRKAIILFDELDSMAPSRNDSYEGSKKIVSIILQNLDGFRSNNNVLIIGTTNRPEDIDPALKRPGRIDKIIAVDLPGVDDRKDILELHINKFKENASESYDLFSPNLDIQKIAESTEGMSGADLANIINLTLETKTVLELEGIKWSSISNTDIERTLTEFNLKKKEKNRIGFNN